MQSLLHPSMRDWQEYVPKIHVQDNLPQIVLQTLASLNAIRTKQEKFIEITIESLRLWVEQMKSNGSIDQELSEK